MISVLCVDTVLVHNVVSNPNQTNTLTHTHAHAHAHTKYISLNQQYTYDNSCLLIYHTSKYDWEQGDDDRSSVLSSCDHTVVIGDHQASW